MNQPACSAGPPESGSGSCPGSKPYTLRSSSNVTLTSLPQILTFFSSMLLVCMVRRRLYSASSISRPLLCMTPRRCPAFVGPLPTWPLWVSDAHRLGLVVQDLQSFIRAPRVPGALHVIRSRPALFLRTFLLVVCRRVFIPVLVVQSAALPYTT